MTLQIQHVEQRPRIAGRIAFQFAQHFFVAASLGFTSGHTAHPPDERMEPPHGLGQSLQQAYPQVAPSNMQQFVCKNRLDRFALQFVDDDRRNQHSHSEESDHSRTDQALGNNETNSPSHTQLFRKRLK